MLGIVGLINAIITNYLLNSNCVTILTDDSSSLYDLMTGKYVPFIHLQGNTSETLLKVLDLGCSDFFIQYKNPSTFLDDLEENIHITNQRNGRRKLVFLPTDNESSPILESLLSHVLLEYIPDVIIVLPKTENIFEIATHKYATNTNHSEMVILDKWFLENETFEFGNDLFVDKIAHLNGRKLRAATFSYTPYSILELNENNEIIGLDGTEMRTALEFCTSVF